MTSSRNSWGQRLRRVAVVTIAIGILAGGAFAATRPAGREDPPPGGVPEAQGETAEQRAVSADPEVNRIAKEIWGLQQACYHSPDRCPHDEISQKRVQLLEAAEAARDRYQAEHPVSED